MKTYDQARLALAQAKEEYERQLDEFAGSSFLHEELDTVEARATVLQLYDELRAPSSGVYSELVYCERDDAVKAAKILRKHYNLLCNEWLRYSSARFLEACEALHTNCLWVARTFYPDDSKVDARDVFRLKNSNYGNSFLRLGVPGVFTRLGDKFTRFETLVTRAEEEGFAGNVGDERLIDTLLDAANYALMAAICHKLSRAVVHLPAR